jgi:hypothetical protein
MRRLLLFLLILIGIGAVSAEYPYWIEDNGDGTYNIWTKICVPANGETTIYVQKADGYSPNGDAVFEFFDDFEGTELDTNKWGDVLGSQYLLDNGILKTSSTNIYSTMTITEPVVITAKSRRELSSMYSYGQIMITDKSGVRNVDYYNEIGVQVLDNGAYYLQDRLVYMTVRSSYYGCSRDFGKSVPDYGTDYVIQNVIVDTNNKIMKVSINGDELPEINYNNGIYDNVNQLITLNGDLTFGIGYEWGSYADFDYIFVRKYADQEPTVSVEQISTDTWKITISNPNDYDLTDFQIKIDGTGIVSSKTDSLFFTDDIQDFYISTSQSIYPVGSSVSLDIYCADTLLNETAYVDWGDGATDVVVMDTATKTIEHIYQQEGTYTITATLLNNTDSKTIVISASVVSTTLQFQPLYENISLDNVYVLIDSGIVMKNVSANDTVKIDAYLNKPIKIQTNQGYITSVKAINGTKTVYLGDTSLQYFTTTFKTNPDSMITIKLSDKEIGYGNPVYTTIPAGATISLYVDGTYVKDETITTTVSEYITKPLEVITVILTKNNDKLQYTIYTSTDNTYLVEIYENDTKVYESLTAFKKGTTTINTDVQVNYGQTYTMKIYKDGVLKKEYRYTPIDVNKPDILQEQPETILLGLVLLVPILLIVLAVGYQNLPFVLVMVGGVLMIMPFEFPYIRGIGGALVGIGLLSFILQKIRGEW